MRCGDSRLEKEKLWRRAIKGSRMMNTGSLYDYEYRFLLCRNDIVENINLKLKNYPES